VLEKRAGGGDGEEGESDGAEEQKNDSPSGIAGRGGFEGFGGGYREEEEGERDERDEREVDGGLEAFPVAEPCGEGVSVGVSGEETDLEEEHAGGPNGGTAAIPREDVACDDGLNLEEQEGAEEDGGDENWHGGSGLRFGMDGWREVRERGRPPEERASTLNIIILMVII
jgi:hypothetical protein